MRRNFRLMARTAAAIAEIGHTRRQRIDFRLTIRSSEIGHALAGVATLASQAISSIRAWRRVAQIDFGVAQIMLFAARESVGAFAGERIHRINGSEQHCVAVYEIGSVAELQHRQALLVVETRLTDAQIIVEWQHLNGRQTSQYRPIQVNAFLQILRCVKLFVHVVRPSSRETDIQHTRVDIGIILNRKQEDILLWAGNDCCQTVQEEIEQWRQECLFGHFVQSNCHRIEEHVLGDETNGEGHNCLRFVDAITHGHFHCGVFRDVCV